MQFRKYGNFGYYMVNFNRSQHGLYIQNRVNLFPIFKPVFLALNRRPTNGSVKSLQWHHILLSCFSLQLSAAGRSLSKEEEEKGGSTDGDGEEGKNDGANGRKLGISPDDDDFTKSSPPNYRLREGLDGDFLGKNCQFF